MNVMLDANCCADAIFAGAEKEPFIKALFFGKAKLTIGGQKMLKEHAKVAAMARLIRTLDQAGKITIVDCAKVDTREKELMEKKSLSSDDPHVIAVGQLSTCRVLYTKDKPLQADFTNPKLISKPRGKIYAGSQHIHLIVSAMPKKH